MAFVCKRTAVLVVRINNMGQKYRCFYRLLATLSLSTLPHTSIVLTSCIYVVF